MPSSTADEISGLPEWSSKLAKKYIKALDRKEEYGFLILIITEFLVNCFITSKKPLLHPIWLKCRQIGPVISPFLNIFQVFYIGSGAVERDEKEDCDEEYFF